MGAARTAALEKLFSTPVFYAHVGKSTVSRDLHTEAGEAVKAEIARRGPSKSGDSRQENADNVLVLRKPVG